MSLAGARLGECRLLPYSLPLQPGWRTAGGAWERRSGALLRLETEDGRVAWGDCAPLRESRALAQLATRVARLRGLWPDEAESFLDAADFDAAARCALDTALCDLAAQHAGLPLARWLNAEAATDVLCNAILGPLDETAAARAERALADGFAVLKLKVGLAPVAQELAHLAALARNLPPAVRLRLDANGAWDWNAAHAFLAGAADLPIEMLEEPLAAATPERIRRLQDGTAIPLALDESLPRLGDPPLVRSAGVRRLVLKPMLLGGLRPALEWARATAIDCIVTTTIDSAVGTLAAAHLAAALNNGLHHGLATARWLARDLGATPAIRGGRMRLDSAPGLGFAPTPELA